MAIVESRGLVPRYTGAYWWHTISIVSANLTAAMGVCENTRRHDAVHRCIHTAFPTLYYTCG